VQVQVQDQAPRVALVTVQCSVASLLAGSSVAHFNFPIELYRASLGNSSRQCPARMRHSLDTFARHIHSTNSPVGGSKIRVQYQHFHATK
jgi:hypothetical protein